MTPVRAADKVPPLIMTVYTSLRTRLPRVALLVLVPSLAACGEDLNFDFERPGEPIEAVLFDLVDGPLDRPSAFNVVSGRGSGLPRVVQVDQTGEWDFAFAVLDGEPVWLPQGFFAGAEPSPGILRLDRGFDEIVEVPGDRTLYEDEQPVPAEVGAVYAIRSRPDPSLSLPCRLFAKVEVLSLEGDPMRIRFRSLWNPNCDQRNVTPR